MGAVSSAAKIEKELGRDGFSHSLFHQSFVICVYGVFRCSCRYLGRLNVVHFHHIDDDGTLGTLNQEGLLVGTTFVDKACQGFFTPGSIDLFQPLSKLIRSSRIHMANGDSQHGHRLP
jgi:hypothetical protein